MTPRRPPPSHDTEPTRSPTRNHDKPTAAAPSTAAPSTAAPSTAAPSTAAPSTAAPSTAAPSTTAPEVRRTQRTRDPEARRAALAKAAMEVVAENGVGRTTHRAVAARAGLPLGATTYYFPTLDDLIAAGLHHALAALQEDLRVWEERLRTAPDWPEALTDLAQEYLKDRRQVHIEYELCVAAARDTALRPLATAWMDGVPDMLAPTIGLAAARDVCAVLDGFILRALATDTELDTTRLTAAIRNLSAKPL